MTISSEVDERTLREISLVPFEAAVREAGAWSVMAAYNKRQRHLLQRASVAARRGAEAGVGVRRVRRVGLVRTHSTAPAGQRRARRRDARAAAVVRRRSSPTRCARATSTRSASTTWCTACWRSSIAPGALDEPDPLAKLPKSPSTTRSTATSPGAPRPEASSSCRTAPPPSRSTGVRTLAVVGPNADIAHVMGGGSARVPTHPLVSPLVGLRSRFGADVEIVHERGCTNNKITPPLDTRFLDGAIEVEYYAGRERAGDPVLVEDSERALLHVDGSGRRRRARRLLGPAARDPGPAGVRRVDVQHRAGRPGARPARRRDVARQLEPDGTGRGVLRDGQRRADADRRSRRRAAATSSSSRRSPPRPRWAACRSGSSRRRPTT